MTGRSSTATIGVNLTWLVPGVVGGSEEYTVRLLEAVGPLIEGTVALRLYVRPELGEAHPGLVDRYRTIVAPPVGSKGARIALEQTWLAARSRSDDFVHHPGGTVPYVRAQPVAVTIHDLQPLEMPENFHPVKRAWLGRGLPYAARAARLVLCPSRFTADRLTELLGVPETKIRVVQHGHRPPSRPAPPPVGDARPDGRFLLYPTIAYAHKRHIDLVRVLDRMGDRFGDVNLVFTGTHGPELGSVLAEAARLGLEQRIQAPGRVSAAELDRLYRSATAMVFPSAYEGFGNPVLEAMSTGCPVVISDAGALPEVAADAALVVPTGDVDALASTVAKLLDDPTLADDLRRRGLARARTFDSGIAARRLADVYGELVASGRS